MAGEVVRVKNVGKVPFRGKYDQQVYDIPVKSQVIVPEDAARHWLGRWDLIDRDFHPERKEEYARLRVLYGAHFSEDGIDENTKWEQNKPQLEVYTLDTEERIFTVVDDPAGERISPATQTKREKGLLEDQVDALKKQLNAVQNVLAQQQMGDRYVATDDEAQNDVEEDIPTKVPVGGRQRGRDQG